MRVQLPLERFASVSEHLYLSGDQLVELGTLETAQVPIPDASAVAPADESQDWPVAFDAEILRHRIRHDGAQLRVVARKEIAWVQFLHGCGLYEGT